MGYYGLPICTLTTGGVARGQPLADAGGWWTGDGNNRWRTASVGRDWGETDTMVAYETAMDR